MKLAKILVSLLLALSLVLGIGLPALADNGKDGKPNVVANHQVKDEDGRWQIRLEVIKGTVTAISGDSITVEHENVPVDAKTKYHIPTLGRQATLADIKVGMEVTVQGQRVNGHRVARQVNVVLKVETHTGNVTAYAYNATTGGSISITEKGTNLALTFDILPGKLNVSPKGSTPKVGDAVTIRAHRDPSSGRLVARSINILPPPIQKVTGTITAIQEIGSDNGTITIGTTVLQYGPRTVFSLRGVGLSVRVGQPAIGFYREIGGVNKATQIKVGNWPTPMPKPTTTAVRPTTA
ncbi:MAG: hypothetical protein HYX90_00510 [Chloroflexi bacterium]|nr:hypothetical protein [Chloroflexota bacterium]